MLTAAISRATLTLEGPLVGWRRATGVPRALLAAVPIYRFLHPDDAVLFAEVILCAEFGVAGAVLRIGQYGRRVPMDFELLGWSGGYSLLEVRAAPIPKSWWWLDPQAFADLPAMPKTLPA